VVCRGALRLSVRSAPMFPGLRVVSYPVRLLAGGVRRWPSAPPRATPFPR